MFMHGNAQFHEALGGCSGNHPAWELEAKAKSLTKSKHTKDWTGIIEGDGADTG